MHVRNTGAPACAAAAIAILLCVAPAAFSQAAPSAADAARLTFPPGATALVVSGSVGGGSAKAYVVNLSAGQPLSLSLLHLRAALGTVGVDVMDAATGADLPGTGRGTSDFRGIVPAGGDYVINVVASPAAGNGASYDLRIDVPALVKFGPGQVAAVRSGSTPSGLPVEYVLALGAGQTLLLDLAAGGDGISLDVNRLDSNRPVFESALSRSLQAAVPIQADGNYLITLFPATGQNNAYRLDIVVPALALPANPIYTAFPGQGHIVVVTKAESTSGTDQDIVASSIDNGSTWRKAVVEGKMVGATFLDGNHGFLTVTREKQADGSLGTCLYETGNGGAAWSQVEMPLPKEMDRNDIATLTPSAPRFLNGSRGFIDVQAVSSSGSSQQLRYMSVDGGRTWSIRTGAAVPVVPDVVGTPGELTACLADNQLPAGSPSSGTFSGRPISQWIAQVQKELSMPVAALSASVSPDGQRLALALAGCHTSQVQPGPFTIFALIDGKGHAVYLGDETGKPSYFNGFTTSNSEGVYQLFGWLGDSKGILINAEPYDLGAGGSCEPTYWASYDTGGQAEAAFQSVGSVALTKDNKVLFYTGPGAAPGPV